MFLCYSYTIIRERINLCLLKLQLLKQSIKIHRCVVNTVVVWLLILGPYRCLYVALFGRSGPKLCSHTTTILTTHQWILMDYYFNNCNFGKHELMCSLMMA